MLQAVSRQRSASEIDDTRMRQDKTKPRASWQIPAVRVWAIRSAKVASIGHECSHKGEASSLSGIRRHTFSGLPGGTTEYTPRDTFDPIIARIRLLQPPRGRQRCATILSPIMYCQVMASMSGRQATDVAILIGFGGSGTQHRLRSTLPGRLGASRGSVHRDLKGMMAHGSESRET